MRKFVSFTASLVLICSIFLSACSKSPDPEPSQSAGASTAAATTEPAQTEAVKADDYAKQLDLSWAIPTQDQVPMSSTNVVQMLEKKFNVKFNFTELPPGQQYDEKKKLMIASQDIPDIMTWVLKDEANQYGPQGAFLEMTPYLDQMPNVKQILEGDPSGKFNAYSAEGKLWRIPDYIYKQPADFGFSVIKNKFDEVGATDLSTWDKLYDGLTKLKAKYPDSYPLVFAGKDFLPLGGTLLMRASIITSFTEGKAGATSSQQWTDSVVTFDADQDKWTFAPTAAGFKDAVAFLAKLYKEKLVDPEILSTDMASLQTKLTTGKGFMTIHFVGGLSGIDANNVNRTLEPLILPHVEGKKEIWSIAGPTINDRGSILNAKLKDDPDKLARTIAIMDYLYSEEFYQFYYYNPDVTTDKDGKKAYVDGFLADVTKKSHYMPWSFMNFKTDTVSTAPEGSPYTAFIGKLTDPANKDKYARPPVLPFTEAQTKKLNELSAAVADIWKAKVDAFIFGKADISEWDALVQECLAKGGTEMTQIYNDVYQQYFKK